MPLVRLKRNWQGVFHRTIGKGDASRRQAFGPGQIVALSDEDFAFVERDIGKSLEIFTPPVANVDEATQSTEPNAADQSPVAPVAVENTTAEQASTDESLMDSVEQAESNETEVTPKKSKRR